MKYDERHGEDAETTPPLGQPIVSAVGPPWLSPSQPQAAAAPAASVMSTGRWSGGKQGKKLAISVLAILLVASSGLAAYLVTHRGPGIGDHSVISSIAVGSRPHRVAESSDGQYLASISDGAGQGSLSVISASSNQVLTRTAVPGLPSLLAVPRGVATAYVAFDDTYVEGVSTPGAVWAIDLRTGSVAATIPSDSQTLRLEASKDGRTLYIISPSAITTVDVATNIAKSRIPMAGVVQVSPDGERIYVTDGAELSAVDARSGAALGSVTLPSSIINDVVFSEDGGYMYLAQESGISAINTATNTLRRIPTDNIPYNMALTPDGATMYATNQLSDQVQVINLANGSLVAVIPVSKLPEGLALSPDGKSLYVCNGGSDSITVVAVTSRASAAASPTPGLAPLPLQVTAPPIAQETTPYPNSDSGDDNYTNSDLGLTVPIAFPRCNNQYVVVVGAAPTPASYRADIQRILDKYPGKADYMKASDCSAFRGKAPNGDEVYVVYLGPYDDPATACSNQAQSSGDSYVKWLSKTVSPGQKVAC